MNGQDRDGEGAWELGGGWWGVMWGEQAEYYSWSVIVLNAGG